MKTYPSRSEQRENLLKAEARKGNFCRERVIVYPNEIKRLERDGFNVSNIVDARIREKKLLVVTVDWSLVFGNGIPHEVYSYINYITDDFPKDQVKNLAEELFVTAHRPNKD